VATQPRRLSSRLPSNLASDLASGPDRIPHVLQSRRTLAGFSFGSARDKVELLDVSAKTAGAWLRGYRRVRLNRAGVNTALRPSMSA
jgi:hypothetical protein